MVDPLADIPLRKITARARGLQHGPIARLISPDGLGEQLKPFIFLDHFNADIEPGFGFGMHPHSGIATLTSQPGSDVRYQDTTGKNGVLKAGGLEWMNAGGGAWHQGELLGHGQVAGFQLWVPMPPGIEDGASSGQYVPPSEVPIVQLAAGELKVLLGTIENDGVVTKSPIQSHQEMSYFVLSLNEGGAWNYFPPKGHNIAWAFGFEGEATAQATPFDGELLVLGSEGKMVFAAPSAPAKVLFGTAVRYRHPLVLGSSSVHSNPTSLANGERQIVELRRKLVAEGLLAL